LSLLLYCSLEQTLTHRFWLFWYQKVTSHKSLYFRR